MRVHRDQLIPCLQSAGWLSRLNDRVRCYCEQVVALLLRNIKLGNPWVKVDLCTGKLVEMGGD